MCVPYLLTFVPYSLLTIDFVYALITDLTFTSNCCQNIERNYIESTITENSEKIILRNIRFESKMILKVRIYLAHFSNNSPSLAHQHHQDGRISHIYLMKTDHFESYEISVQSFFFRYYDF